MRLRVIRGDRPSTIPSAPDLAVVHRAQGLTIEASSDVRRIGNDSQAPVFVAGDVWGVFQRNGTLQGITGTASLGDVIRGNTASRCRELLEGRYLIAAVRPDGECELFSDRFGKRDLYIQPSGGSTVAATDLSLLPVATGRPDYDPVALAHTLVVYGWRPAKKQTLYRDVSRLGVGETLRLGPNGSRVEAARFAPLQTAPYAERDLHRYADILIDAVGSQASTDGNVVYLSSGWDSTAILACLVHLFGPRKVRAVIGRMRYSERSGVINKFEISRAAEVAAFFDVPLEVVEIDYRERGPDLLERLGPVLRANQLASMTALSHGYLAEHVARTARGGEAVFAGEISDGAHNLGFSQFTTIFHPVLEFREYSDKMASYLFGPTFLGSLAAGTHARDPIFRWMCDRYPAESFDAWAQGSAADHTRSLLASFFLRSNRLPLWSLGGNRLLTSSGREMYGAAMEAMYLSEPSARATPEDLYAWYLWLYNSFHWQGSTVATLPVTAEANGFHVALPFWDARLQDFLSAMPESWGRGLDLNPTKYPLKWTLRNRVRYPNHLQVGPHSYLYDVDHSFNLAFEVIYHSSFAPYFREKLRGRGYRSLLPPDTFDVGYIDGVVGRYLDGTELTGAELNDLVSICWISAVGWYGG